MVGAVVGTVLGTTIYNAVNSDNEQSDSGKHDQKLSNGEIKKLLKGGVNPEELKGGKSTGGLDLFKDKKGNISIKPSSGLGPGDPTGININDF